MSIVLSAWPRPPSWPGAREEEEQQNEGALSTHMDLPAWFQATVGKVIKSITFPLHCLSFASSPSNIFSRNHPTSLYCLATHTHTHTHARTHTHTTRATPTLATTPTTPTTEPVLWSTTKGKTKATEHIHLSDIGLGREDSVHTRGSSSKGARRQQRRPTAPCAIRSSSGTRFASVSTTSIASTRARPTGSAATSCRRRSSWLDMLASGTRCGSTSRHRRCVEAVTPTRATRARPATVNTVRRTGADAP